MSLIALAHSAEMRSNLSLLRKANRVIPHNQYRQIYEQTLHYLELRNLNYPPSMISVGLNKNMSFHEKKEALGLSSSVREKTAGEIEFEEFLEQSAAKTRQTNWLWRVGAAAADLQEKGWFPFFVTLTVDPSKANPRDLWQEGDAFRRWKRQMSLVVTRALGHPPAHKSNVPDSVYFRYFGVLEHGQSRVHDHMHVLLWLREIPESWKKCPNRGIKNPEMRTKQRCLPLETYWPWSNPLNRPAVYFRTVGDVWGQLGFTTPYLVKQKKFLCPAAPIKAGAYCAKYMGKDEKEWKHRVHATRNLGTELLTDRLRRLSMKKLEALSWRPGNQSLLISLQTIHSVPNGLLRWHAKRELWLKKYSKGQLDWTAELMSNYDSFSAMRSSVRAGARPSRMGSKERYDWLGKHLPEQEGYCEKRLKSAHRSLQYLFPEVPNEETKRIGITYV